MAASASPTAPMTSKPGSALISPFSPLRTAGWSSTIRTDVDAADAPVRRTTAPPALLVRSAWVVGFIGTIVATPDLRVHGAWRSFTGPAAPTNRYVADARVERATGLHFRLDYRQHGCGEAGGARRMPQHGGRCAREMRATTHWRAPPLCAR